MYETIFGFHSRPFASKTACSEHAMFGQSMQKALSNVSQCIDRGSGPAMILGAPGVGKSSLLAALGHQYRDQFHIVNMSCSRLDGRQEFLQTVLFELRQPYRGFSEGELRLSLLDFLRSDQQKPNGILLLIDDGENLSVEVLDEIRVVSNFVQDGQPRTRLVLTGGFRLEELLADSRLHSLNQRIAARCFLRSLTHAESDEYVREQIRRSGGDAEALFGDESLQAIFELTEGCPRHINQLCDHVLILCATYGRRQVDAGMVREAWSDLQCLPDAFSGAQGQSSICQATKELISDQGKWSIIEFGSLEESPVVGQVRIPVESIPNSNEDSTRHSSAEPECGDLSRCVAQEFHSFTGEVGDAWRFSSPASFNPYESQTNWAPSGKNSDMDQSEACWGDQDLDQSQAVYELPSSEIESTYTAPNPFEEQFEEVEVVASRFAKRIAECNRASQDLTPSDLFGLDSIADTLSSEPQSSLEVSYECCKSSEAWEHRSEQKGYEVVYQSPDPQPWIKPEQRDELPQAISRFSSPPFTIAANGPAPSTQIEQEADALIQQLSNAFGEPIDHFSRPFEVSHGNLGADEVYTLRMPPEPTHGAIPGDTATSGSQDTEIQELDSLKRAIEEQNRFSAQAFDRLIVQSNEQNAADAWQGPAQWQSDATPIDSSTVPNRDDREILICQPSDSVAMESCNPAERLPFPPTPVSTGRAERMDYQQLFNQLRNLPDT
jgi:type II secretory pathway predicted ATPase ExeA